MLVAIRQLVCAMVAVGMFLVPTMGSAQEFDGKSAELAQFEKNVAQLRALQGAPATPASTGLRLNSESPATLLNGRFSAEGTPLQQAFVVWLQNSGSTYLTTILYWQNVNSSTVHQTSAGVAPGQVAPHITSACGTVAAYILDIYENGVFVATTGATQPISTDGDPCADAWQIQ